MQISENLYGEFADFLSNVPARRLKQSSIKLLLYFLKFECTEGMPDFMDSFFADFTALLDLLDTIECEVDQSGLV